MTNIDNFNIIEASKSFKKKYGIDLLREEAKILILLEKHGGLSTKNLMSFLARLIHQKCPEGLAGVA
jgi:hypothetical protein